MKDLGVHIDSMLKFREHASAAVAKANQILAVIRRSFALIDERTLPLLFKTLVRPHLEYGNLVWGPFNRADQKRVERTQRRATRLVASIRLLPYQERLRILKLPSLYYRRRRGDMIQTYQLFHGGVDMDPASIFTLADRIRNTRVHPFKLHKVPAVGRVRRSVFAVRVVNDWNSLPPEVLSHEKNPLETTRISLVVLVVSCGFLWFLVVPCGIALVVKWIFVVSCGTLWCYASGL